MRFSHPASLQRKQAFDGHEIEYQDLAELCQGGPEVGSLFIDGNRVGDGARFGGPLLCYQGAIYIPVYKKYFFSSGFFLARIDLINGQLFMIGRRKGLIYLDRIEDGIAHYYTDSEKNRLESISLK